MRGMISGSAGIPQYHTTSGWCTSIWQLMNLWENYDYQIRVIIWIELLDRIELLDMDFPPTR